MFTRSSSVLCTVYVSTSVPSLLTSFQSLVADSLVHSFPDPAYNRTSFYLMSTCKSNLEGMRSNITSHIQSCFLIACFFPTIDQALLLCQQAVSSLDFRQHSGTHPTLGIIDNIVFSPMGEESIENTAGIYFY